MKVKIGPYLTWWGPYQIADLLQYFGVSEDRCHAIGKRLADIEWLSSLCEWIYSKRNRTVKVKIDKFDTWNMDSTLAIIILPMLKQLKETKHGYPISLCEGSSNSAQYCFDFYEETEDAVWTTAEKRWNDIFDEMIWAFTQLQPDYDWEEQYWIKSPKIDFRGSNGEMALSGELDVEGMRAHQNRITEGLKLFGQYYQNLWD